MTTVRPAVLADAAEMARLHALCFGAAAWDEAQLAGSLALDSTKGWFSEAGGFILCQLMGDEAEILTFCVAPDRQRQGVGRALMAAAVQGLAATLFLEVAEDNHPARALYEAAGFRQVGRRRGYYTHGAEAVDALLYRKTAGN